MKKATLAALLLALCLCAASAASAAVPTLVPSSQRDWTTTTIHDINSDIAAAGLVDSATGNPVTSFGANHRWDLSLTMGDRINPQTLYNVYDMSSGKLLYVIDFSQVYANTGGTGGTGSTGNTGNTGDPGNTGSIVITNTTSNTTIGENVGGTVAAGKNGASVEIVQVLVDGNWVAGVMGGDIPEDEILVNGTTARYVIISIKGQSMLEQARSNSTDAVVLILR